MENHSPSRQRKRLRPLKLTGVVSEGQPHVSRAAIFPSVLCLSTEARLCLPAQQLAQLQLRLGASEAQQWHEGVTHVIALSLRRTERLMCAVCCGQHIITPQWVSASLEAGQEVSADDYLLCDKLAEAALGTTLRASLQRARQRPLLAGLSVYLETDIQGAVRQAAKRVVSAAGGQLTTHCPNGTGISSAVIIISKPENRDQLEAPGHRQKYSTELLFEGAMTQQLRWEAHQL